MVLQKFKQARLEDETVWLAQKLIAKLFQKAKFTINEYILNIYKENELVKAASMRKIENSDFSTKPDALNFVTNLAKKTPPVLK